MSAEAPRLHVQIHAGAADGPYVFMVHGLLSSLHQWDANLAAIAQVARPVVFDLWGHGRSPAPQDPSMYAIEALHAQFEQVREALGAQRVVLCGQSFGAGLTLGYALSFPKRVIAQIFTNSNSALSPATRFEVSGERLAMVTALEQDGDAGRVALRGLRIHPSRAKRIDPAIRDLLAREADLADPRGIARLMRYTAPRLSVIDRLGATACPTLLVNGRHEAVFQPLRERLPALLPGCQVVDLNGGHAVNIEAAAGFNEAVPAFIRASVQTNTGASTRS